MSAYWFGKEAAMEDLASVIDMGYGTEGVLEVIRDTLDQPIHKFASEEDVEARLGIESVCYDFLKEASDYYATMDVYDEAEAMLDCFVKVAKKKPGVMGDTSGPSYARAPNTGRYLIERMRGDYDLSKKERKAARKEYDKLDAQNITGLSNMGKTLGHQAAHVGAEAGKYMGVRGRQAKDAYVRSLKGKKGRGAQALALGGTLAAGYGAKKLYDKYNEED